MEGNEFAGQWTVKSRYIKKKRFFHGRMPCLLRTSLVLSLSCLFLAPSVSPEDTDLWKKCLCCDYDKKGHGVTQS